MKPHERYEIIFDQHLKLLDGRDYRVIDHASRGIFLMDTDTGRAAFTLKQASEFLYRLAIKNVMERYLKGEQE